MSVNIMQFKSRIRNLAKEEGVPAQVEGLKTSTGTGQLFLQRLAGRRF